MKNFDLESFKEGKIVVHCKTKKEAEDFCRQMHKQGMVWGTGNSYLSCTHYEEYKNKTCYSGGGGYQSYDYFEKYRCNILEWSDYMNKEFTKSDLKDGMVVKYNDNCFGKRLVIGGFLIGEDGYADLGDYNENLKSMASDLEIVRVYKIKHMGKFSSIMKNHKLELIWERKEPKKMTVEEMRQKLEELTGEQIEVTA